MRAEGVAHLAEGLVQFADQIAEVVQCLQVGLASADKAKI
jgi:hypothetical protein